MWTYSWPVIAELLPPKKLRMLDLSLRDKTIKTHSEYYSLHHRRSWRFQACLAPKTAIHCQELGSMGPCSIFLGSKKQRTRKKKKILYNELVPPGFFVSIWFRKYQPIWLFPPVSIQFPRIITAALSITQSVSILHLIFYLLKLKNYIPIRV